MGLLVDGYWTDRWHDTSASSGRFQRPESAFRNWVTPDGTPGPTGDGGFKAEPGRYHLYVSLACPWAHRTLIFRALKGLETAISLSVVHWFMGEHGWTFEEGPGVISDPVAGADRLYEISRMSSGTIIEATRRSTRPASSPSDPSSISWRRTAASFSPHRVLNSRKMLTWGRPRCQDETVEVMMEIASCPTAGVEPRRRFEYWNGLVSKAVRGLHVVQPRPRLNLTHTRSTQSVTPSAGEGLGSL